MVKHLGGGLIDHRQMAAGLAPIAESMVQHDDAPATANRRMATAGRSIGTDSVLIRPS